MGNNQLERQEHQADCNQGERRGGKRGKERERAGLQKVQGPGHPEALLALAGHGNLLLRMGDAAAAEPELRRAVAGLEKVLGGGHKLTQWAAGRLAAARA